MIASPTELDAIHRDLVDNGITPGVLRIMDGSLQQGDFISCTLRCTRCGQKFQLTCETYHGGGGNFTPVA